MFRSGLADDRTKLAILLSETARLAESDVEYRAALALRQELADDNPAVVDFRRNVAESHLNLGQLLAKSGKPADAERECREAIAILEKLAAESTSVPEIRSYLATSRSTLGALLAARAGPRRLRPSAARRSRSYESWPKITATSPTFGPSSAKAP